MFLCIYLFLALLGLHCCTLAFSSCGKLGLLFTAVLGLLIAVASLVVSRGSRVCKLQWLWFLGSRAQAQYLWCIGFSCSAACRIFLDQGPVCLALAGRFFTTEPPGKS